jgi:phosphate/sulfate permease
MGTGHFVDLLQKLNYSLKREITEKEDVMKKITAILLTVSIVLMSSMAFAAGSDDSSDVITDIIFLRPIGFVSTVLGTALYVIALPTAAATDSVDHVRETLVTKPYNYTFKRPVGEIESGLE